MKRTFVKAASTAKMLDAFRNKIDELSASTSINGAVDMQDDNYGASLSFDLDDNKLDQKQVELEETGRYDGRVQEAIQEWNDKYDDGVGHGDASFVLFVGYGLVPDVDYVGVPPYTVYLTYDGASADDDVVKELAVPGSVEQLRSVESSTNIDSIEAASSADMIDAFYQRIDELKNVDSSTDTRGCDDGIVDEGLESVEGSEWGEDKVFMLIDYSPDSGENGMEGDEFYPMGKFFAENIDDAKAQLEEASSSQADRLVHLSQPYVTKYNEYFDDGSEVYPNLETLITKQIRSQEEIDEDPYDIDEMGNPVYNSCDVEAASTEDDEEEYVGSDDYEDDYSSDDTDEYDPEFDSSEDDWEQIDKKSIRDSDGFLTEYTLYRNVVTDLYVCVYGDSDIYRPEDGYFDFETENYDEAIEWFNSYSGDDEEDY